MDLLSIHQLISIKTASTNITSIQLDIRLGCRGLLIIRTGLTGGREPRPPEHRERRGIARQTEDPVGMPRAVPTVDMAETPMAPVLREVLAAMADRQAAMAGPAEPVEWVMARKAESETAESGEMAGMRLPVAMEMAVRAAPVARAAMGLTWTPILAVRAERAATVAMAACLDREVTAAMAASEAMATQVVTVGMAATVAMA